MDERNKIPERVQAGVAWLDSIGNTTWPELTIKDYWDAFDDHTGNLAIAMTPQERVDLGLNSPQRTESGNPSWTDEYSVELENAWIEAARQRIGENQK